MSTFTNGTPAGNKKLTPLSHSVIALSTAYHEYNPMLISSLKSIILLNGVDCIIKEQNGSQYVLPVSKCDIVGIIVFCHYKANGSVVMVIDDGTGFFDCIGWIDDEEMNAYKVSDLVRVSGAIKILALKHKKIVNVDGVIYEGWFCSRELQIHSLQLVIDKNMEALHWLCCLQFQKRIGIGANDICADKIQSTNLQEQIMNTPVLNGLETFHLLPENERNCIMSSRGTEDSFLQFEGDELSLMHYFGRDCKCAMNYKNAILYCHCLATNEALDPNFVFRDAVLIKLLEMEALLDDHGKSKNNLAASNHTDSNKDEIYVAGRKLEFDFGIIFNDQKLQKIASDIVANTSHPSINTRRLYTNTFKHLRHDGVLYLLNSNADTYLFISKDRVLLPAVMALEVENEHSDYNYKLTGKPTKRLRKIPKFLERGAISPAKLRIAKKLVASQRKQIDQNT